MIRTTNRITSLAATVAVLALAVPATASATVDVRNPDSKAAAIDAQRNQVDLRNPDSRHAAESNQAESTYVDLRNPDSRGSKASATEETYVDLRSPDSRDVGQQAQTPSPAPVIVQASEFDWSAAAIGAGSVLGLLLIGGAGTFLVTHRRSQGATA
jgi:hypothetical protein